MDEPSSVERLWEEFKLKASADARERLILHYSPLVKYVAGRVGVGLPPNIEQADLVSYGIFGLIDAIEKFDLERAHQVRDLRDHAGSAARSSTSSAPSTGSRARSGYKAREVEKAYAPLEAELHRTPDRGRGRRSSMGIALDDLHQIFSQVSFVNVVALDELLSVGGEQAATGSAWSTPWRTPGPRTRSAASSPRRRSASSPRRSTRLPEREKIVVTLYYYEGLTLAEIGQVLGVTESRICQMHTKAVLQLRAKMQDAR